MNIDDLPVGKTTEQPPEFAEPVDTEAPKGPIGARVADKSWSVRFQAFEELSKELRVAEPDGCLFKEMGPKFHKYITDSHQGVQEKAVEALYEFLERYVEAGKYIEHIISALITKCLIAGKQTTKKRAMDCLLKSAEISNDPNSLSEAILGAIKQKNLKIQTAGLQAGWNLLQSFGIKKVSLQPYLKELPKLSQSTNLPVKTEAINFLKEIHKWMGEALEAFLEPLKKIQREEMEKCYLEFKETGGKAIPTMRTRTDEAQFRELEESKEGANLEEEEKPLDPYDMMEEQSILGDFTEKWCDKLKAMEKWKEKKDCMTDFINKLENTKKIKPEGYMHLVGVFKRVMNDSNVVVAQEAIRCTWKMAEGLRDNFAQGAKIMFPLLILKFKDKKLTTVLHNTLEALRFSLNLEDVLEQIKESLNDKTPMVRKGCVLWLTKAILGLDAEVLKKCGKELGGILISKTDESTSDIRDSIMTAVGTLLGRFGGMYLKQIEMLNLQKREKIYQAVEEVPAKLRLPGIKPFNIPNKEETAPPLQKQGSRKILSPNKLDNEETPMVDVTKSTLARVPSGKVLPKAKATKVPKPTTKVSKPTNKSKIVEEEKKEEEIPHGEPISFEEAERMLEEKLPLDIFKGLGRKETKEKKEGMTGLKEWIGNPDNQPSPLSEAIVVVLKQIMKGWKESTLMIMKECFAILDVLTAIGPLNKRSAALILPYCAEKSADNKVKEIVFNILFNLAKLGPGSLFIINKILKTGTGAKNINILKGCAMSIAKIIEEFGIKGLQIKSIVSFGIEILNNGNQAVKSTGYPIFVAIYSYLGENFKLFLGEVKEGSMKTLEQEFQKTEMKIQVDAPGETGGSNEVLDEIFPREDISKELTKKIIQNISDNNWKVKKQALEEIQQILKNHNKRILPNNLGHLFAAIKARMNDSNKMIVKGYMGLLGDLAESLGPPVKIYKHLLPKVLANLADKNPQVRTEAFDTLEKFGCFGGFDIVINQAAGFLGQDNQDIRIQLLKLIISHSEYLPKSDTKSLVGPLVSNLQDKTKDVRSMAEEVVEKVIELIGTRDFYIGIQDLKPTPKQNISAILEKYAEVQSMSRVLSKGVLPKNPEPAVEEEVPMQDPYVELPKEPEVPCVGMAQMHIAGGGNREEEAPMVDDISPTINLNPIIQGNSPQVIDNASQERPQTSSTPNQKKSFSASKSGIIGTNRRHGYSPSEGVASPVKTIRGGTNKPPKGGLSFQRRGSRQTSDLINSRSEVDLMNTGSKSGMTRMQSQRVFNNNRRPGTAKSHRTVSNYSNPTTPLHAHGGNFGCESLIINPGGKGKRAEIDKKCKWPSDELRKEYVEKAKKEMNLRINPGVYANMFARKWQEQQEAINEFKLCLESELDDIISVLDLVFKWIIIRFLEQPTNQVINNMLKFTKALIEALTLKNYELQDQESALLLPLFIEKTGINNLPFRQEIKEQIMSCCKICSPFKVFNYQMQGLNSKNKKTKAETLDLIAMMFRGYAMTVCNIRDIKYIAKSIDQPDKDIRLNALNAMAEAYRCTGDTIWKMIGEVPPKVRDMLESRIRQMELGGYDEEEEEGGSQEEHLGNNEVSKSVETIQIQEINLPSGEGDSPNPHNNNLEGFQRVDTPPGEDRDRDIERVVREASPPAPIEECSNSMGEERKEESPESAVSVQELEVIPEIMEETTIVYSGKPSLVGIPIPIDEGEGEQLEGNIMYSNKDPPFLETENSDRDEREQLENEEFKKVEEEIKEEIRNSVKNTPTKRSMNMVTELIAEPITQAEPMREFELGGGTLNIENVLDMQDMQDTHPSLNSREYLHTALTNLKMGEMTTRVDALVCLNEMITQKFDFHKDALLAMVTDITSTFTYVLHDIFSKNKESIPTRFGKYFIAILMKVCSVRPLMKDLQKDPMLLFVEEILAKLLYNGLENLGEKDEGENMMKNLNSTMLRVLENCDETRLFIVFLELLTKHKTVELIPKMPGLIVKCLLKLTKVMDHIIDNLQLDEVLLSIHKYLLIHPSNPHMARKQEELGTRIVKTIINELVKRKRDSIWNYYGLVSHHPYADLHIKRWIQIIQKSLSSSFVFNSAIGGGARQGMGAPTAPLLGVGTQGAGGEILVPTLPPTHDIPIGENKQIETSDELKEIVRGLKSTDSFEHAIQSLNEYLKRNPEVNPEGLFANCSKTFTDYVMLSLQKLRLQEEKYAPNSIYNI